LSILNKNIPFTVENYVQKLVAAGAIIPDYAQNFSLERIVGLLEANLAKQLITNGEFPERTVMTNPHIIFQIGNEATKEIIAKVVKIGEEQLEGTLQNSKFNKKTCKTVRQKY
jgi:hypothetical protein